MEGNISESSQNDLSSTMGGVLSSLNEKQADETAVCATTSDSIPSSSSDANIGRTMTDSGQEDPISSTSDTFGDFYKQTIGAGQNIVIIKTSVDTEADLFASDLNISDVPNEKITEDVEDIVNDLENLLGESTEDYTVSKTTNSNESSRLDAENLEDLLNNLETKKETGSEISKEVANNTDIVSSDYMHSENKPSGINEENLDSLTVNKTPADASEVENKVVEEESDVKQIYTVDQHGDCTLLKKLNVIEQATSSDSKAVDDISNNIEIPEESEPCKDIVEKQVAVSENIEVSEKDNIKTEETVFVDKQEITSEKEIEVTVVLDDIKQQKENVSEYAADTIEVSKDENKVQIVEQQEDISKIVENTLEVSRSENEEQLIKPQEESSKSSNNEIIEAQESNEIVADMHDIHKDLEVIKQENENSEEQESNFQEPLIKADKTKEITAEKESVSTSSDIYETHNKEKTDVSNEILEQQKENTFDIVEEQLEIEETIEIAESIVQEEDADEIDKIAQQKECQSAATNISETDNEKLVQAFKENEEDISSAEQKDVENNKIFEPQKENNIVSDLLVSNANDGEEETEEALEVFEQQIEKVVIQNEDEKAIEVTEIIQQEEGHSVEVSKSKIEDVEAQDSDVTEQEIIPDIDKLETICSVSVISDNVQNDIQENVANNDFIASEEQETSENHDEVMEKPEEQLISAVQSLQECGANNESLASEEQQIHEEHKLIEKCEEQLISAAQNLQESGANNESLASEEQEIYDHAVIETCEEQLISSAQNVQESGANNEFLSSEEQEIYEDHDVIEEPEEPLISEAQSLQDSGANNESLATEEQEIYEDHDVIEKPEEQLISEAQSLQESGANSESLASEEQEIYEHPDVIEEPEEPIISEAQSLQESGANNETLEVIEKPEEMLIETIEIEITDSIQQNANVTTLDISKTIHEGEEIQVKTVSEKFDEQESKNISGQHLVEERVQLIENIFDSCANPNDENEHPTASMELLADTHIVAEATEIPVISEELKNVTENSADNTQTKIRSPLSQEINMDDELAGENSETVSDKNSGESCSGEVELTNEVTLLESVTEIIPEQELEADMFEIAIADTNLAEDVDPGPKADDEEKVTTIGLQQATKDIESKTEEKQTLQPILMDRNDDNKDSLHDSPIEEIIDESEGSKTCTDIFIDENASIEDRTDASLKEEKNNGDSKESKISTEETLENVDNTESLEVKIDGESNESKMSTAETEKDSLTNEENIEKVESDKDVIMEQIPKEEINTESIIISVCKQELKRKLEDSNVDVKAKKFKDSEITITPSAIEEPQNEESTDKDSLKHIKDCAENRTEQTEESEVVNISIVDPMDHEVTKSLDPSSGNDSESSNFENESVISTNKEDAEHVTNKKECAIVENVDEASVETSLGLGPTEIVDTKERLEAEIATKEITLQVENKDESSDIIACHEALSMKEISEEIILDTSTVEECVITTEAETPLKLNENVELEISEVSANTEITVNEEISMIEEVVENIGIAVSEEISAIDEIVENQKATNSDLSIIENAEFAVENDEQVELNKNKSIDQTSVHDEKCVDSTDTEIRSDQQVSTVAMEIISDKAELEKQIENVKLNNVMTDAEEANSTVPENAEYETIENVAEVVDAESNEEILQVQDNSLIEMEEDNLLPTNSSQTTKEIDDAVRSILQVETYESIEINIPQESSEYNEPAQINTSLNELMLNKNVDDMLLEQTESIENITMDTSPDNLLIQQEDPKEAPYEKVVQPVESRSDKPVVEEIADSEMVSKTVVELSVADTTESEIGNVIPTALEIMSKRSDEAEPKSEKKPEKVKQAKPKTELNKILTIEVEENQSEIYETSNDETLECSSRSDLEEGKPEYSSRISKDEDLKMTITKQKPDESHSILKIYNPDDTKEAIPKLRIKANQQEVVETVPKLNLKATKSLDSQSSPKRTFRNNSPKTSESLSPKINTRNNSPSSQRANRKSELLSPLKLTIKPVIKPEENQSRSSPKITIKPIVKPEIKTEDEGGETSKGSPKITIKPIVKPDDEITSKSNIKSKQKAQEDLPTETAKGNPKITIKPILKPEDDEPLEASRPSSKLTKGASKTSDETRSSPKVTIKPIMKPENEEIAEISKSHHKSASKVSAKAAKTNNESHSPKITIKPVIKPDNAEESSRGSPKITIKPIIKDEDDMNFEASQYSPKITIKSILRGDDEDNADHARSSPKITIKPIVKPEEESDVLHHSPKITIKPIVKPDEEILETSRGSPKVTIKPITKLDEDNIEIMHHSPKITIKPIPKPAESTETLTSPRITIKPIVKPEERKETVCIEDILHSPKITIKPIHKPHDTAEMAHSPRITIKPIIKPQESEPEICITPKGSKHKKQYEAPSTEDVTLVDFEDQIKQERIVLKIHKNTLPTPTSSRKREFVDEEEKSTKLGKIKLKFSKEGGRAKIVKELKRHGAHSIEVAEQKRAKLDEKSERNDDVVEIIQIFDGEERKEDPMASAEPVVIIEPVRDPLDTIPVFEITPESAAAIKKGKDINTTPTTTALPETPTPRKRGRPRKVPLEVREEFKEEAQVEVSTRPKRSCRGPSVRTTLGIKPRKPRVPGRGRGGKRGVAAGRVGRPPGRAKLSATKLKLLKATVDKEAEEEVKDAEMKEVVEIETPEVTEDVVMYEEETRMSAETSTSSRAHTPAKQIPTPIVPDVEESQSSVQSTATTESVKARRSGPRLEVYQEPEGAVISAEQLAEYYWGGGGPFMLQEQVAQFLGIKSFKRKYPGIKRRTVDMQERDFIREQSLASEAMCDLGLTAVNSSDILDIMYSDFQNKYEEYCKHQRDRQVKDLSNKQRALSLAASQEKNKLDIVQQAVQSAATWNAGFNKSRKEERRACMDLQTFTVNYPKGRIKQINKPKIGHYPLALVPGQFTDYYKTFTPTEINNLPLNTMCYEPIVVQEIEDSQSDCSGSDSDSTSSDSDSTSSDSSDEDCNLCTPPSTPKNVLAH